MFKPNAFIRIGADDQVTLVVSMAEMGQGVLTSLAQLLADDLEVDWRKIRVEQAPVDPAYINSALGLQGTGGSSSVRAFWDPLRKAGATAREMLISAAAETWGVPRATCRAREGFVHAGKRRLSYGALAARAAGIAPPADAPLKDAREFRFIGKAVPRVDTPDKVCGRARFGLDVQAVGLLTALVAFPPVIGAKMVSFDATRAKAIAGVRHVVALDAGVAVIATGFWAARLGRDALEVKWDTDAKPELSSDALKSAMQAKLDTTGVIARHEGEVRDSAAATPLESLYEVPYLAHACMEPMNCTASVRADGIDIWAPTQASGVNRVVIAQITGVAPERVQVTTTLLGGGFGRRFAQDFVIAAVQASKAAAAPVKLVYTREDDMHGQFYRPASVVRLRAGLDASGAPASFDARVVCSSVSKAGGFPLKDGLDGTAVEGIKEWPYHTPAIHVEWIPFEPGIGVWFWRSVGHSQNGFFAESFIDELAHAARQDPFEYRRNLLAPGDRRRAVLELAAQKAGWKTPLPKGHARGIAVCESFGSYVAEVVEASLDANGSPKVHRVVCAVDCGRIVNPGIIRRQVQSAVIFGLSAALHGAITLKDGRVEQKNFDDYAVARMKDAPAVEVHILPSSEPPGGVGEPGTPPLAPALANALFALTGRRVRRLPINIEDLRA
ncbi:MAG: xanthine dehydrogenase family protein molybdopterin-binding subunit [Steroidobacteraceae bacterium]